RPAFLARSKNIVRVPEPPEAAIRCGQRQLYQQRRPIMAARMTHGAHSSGGFGSFLFGVVATLMVLAALAFWMGARTPSRTVALEPPSISIPAPRLPPPPGVVPKASH